MISFLSISDLLKDIKGLTSQLQVFRILQEFLPKIIEKSGLRNIDEIMEFIIEGSYEILPLPIRMIIKKDVYVSVITENKMKVADLISTCL